MSTRGSSESPDPVDALPHVQGLPLCLLSSLGTLGGLLLVLGGCSLLYTVWAELHAGVRLGLLAAPALVFLVWHVVRTLRRGWRVFSPAFVALLLAQLALLPAWWYAEVYLPAWAGAFLGLVYALCLLWYGAEYACSVLISAACILIFALALSLPAFLSLSMELTAGLQCLLGLGALGAAVVLHRRRARRLAELRSPHIRREQSCRLDSAAAEDKAPAEASEE